MGNDPISVTYTGPDGKDEQITTSGIYQQLQQAGYPVTGVSADGMEFHFNDPRGEYSMAVPDILKNMGHEVKYVEPTAPDDSKLNLLYRSAVSRLPDDDAKKAYLESKLKREGVENANVIGYGRDWHYFDPSTNQWHSLTNTKDWDTGDLAEAGLETVHGLGAAGGAIAGTGVAGPFGTVAGAAAGGAASEAAIRGALNYFDPEYADVTTLGGQLKDVAIGSALDAGLAGGGALAGRLAKPLMASGKQAFSRAIAQGATEAEAKILANAASEESLKHMARTGIGSTILKGAGTTLDATGSLVGAGGKALDNQLVREGFKAITPVFSQAQMAAMALQAPEYATNAVAKGANAVGKTKFLKDMVGKDAAETFAQGAEEVVSKQAPLSGVDTFNRQFRGSAADAPTIKSRNILRNVAEKAAKGMDASEETIARAAKYGQNTGKAFENMGTIGRNIDKGTDTAVKGFGLGLKGAGAVTKGVGKAAYGIGSVAQPFENMALASAGAREALEDPLRKLLLEKERKALQNKLKGSKIEQSFAHN